MRIAVIVLWALLAPVARAGAAPEERGLCSVCALNGESEPEKVVATREYNGVTYPFCNEKCADAFVLEPAAYVFTPGPAPAAMFVSLAGDTLTVGAGAGDPLLLDFWATWCKPCVKSMPELDALYREFRARGVRVAGVAIDTGKDREKKVRKFVAKGGASYPVAIDHEEDPAWQSFGVKVLSSIFLIDRNGTIVRRWTGVVDMDDVKRAVEALLESEGTGGSR